MLAAVIVFLQWDQIMSEYVRNVAIRAPSRNVADKTLRQRDSFLLFDLNILKQPIRQNHDQAFVRCTKLLTFAA